MHPASTYGTHTALASLAQTPVPLADTSAEAYARHLDHPAMVMTTPAK